MGCGALAAVSGLTPGLRAWVEVTDLESTYLLGLFNEVDGETCGRYCFLLHTLESCVVCVWCQTEGSAWVSRGHFA